MKHSRILNFIWVGLLSYRPDRNLNCGGGVMIFVKEDIPSKLLTKHNFQSDAEGLFVWLNFRKSKWLLLGTYHPPAQNDQYFFNCVDKALHNYRNYGNALLAGDFDVEEDEPCSICHKGNGTWYQVYRANDLRLRILGNYKILRKCQNWMETEPSTQSPFQT